MMKLDIRREDYILKRVKKNITNGNKVVSLTIKKDAVTDRHIMR
tara:strand:- start:294 stop:425 length:132 start_codon:yes stop_codon:yes gene_type:complete